MFANLLFLILVLLLVNIAIDIDLTFWIGAPTASFEFGLIFYFLLLILIYLQTRFFKRMALRHKNSFLFLINLELISFLAYFHFVLGAHRLFFKHSQAMISLFALLLYFGGLWVFHYTFSRIKKTSRRNSLSEAFLQVRFLLPFVIPFLLFALFLDFLKTLPISSLQDILNSHDSPLASLVLLLVSVGFLILMMIFLPPLIQWIWNCKDIEEGELKNRLEAISQRAHFRHAGFKTWTILNHSLTAAIVGIVPRYRYIMFTKRLLKLLSPESIEAILVHEIGHSYRRHLLIYPVVIFGMIVMCGLFSLFFSEGISKYLILQNFLFPSSLWKTLGIFVIFIPYALIIALYFRYIFGYFSRTFERQADLHGFILNLPSKHMIEALDRIAIATGHTHRQPSWHHYSIQERIDFLEKAENNSFVITRHHRKAKASLYIYLSALFLSFAILISPFMPDLPVFKQLSTFAKSASSRFSQWLNRSTEKRASEKLRQSYQLKGNQPVIEEALEKMFSTLSSTEPGVPEFYGAEALFQEGEFSAAAVLMMGAWKNFDFNRATEETVQLFSLLTHRILNHLNESEEARHLKKVYRLSLDRFSNG